MKQEFTEVTITYKDRATSIDKRVGSLFKTAPTVMTPYSQLVKAASGSGALDSKTKELMAFSISIAIRCEDCIVFHLRAALNHGADRDEVIEQKLDGDFASPHFVHLGVAHG